MGGGWVTNPAAAHSPNSFEIPRRSISEPREAHRFVAGMATFVDSGKAELLAQLTDHRNHGLRRIPDALSFIATIQDVERLLIRMLDHVMAPETDRPTYQSLRNKVLWSIYWVPGLLEKLVDIEAAQHLSLSSASKLCSFLLAVSRTLLVARASEEVRTLARELRDMGDVPDP